MSAQMKHTLAALLSAAAIIVPPNAEAKGDKGHGGEGDGQEQNHGGEFRGVGKNAEQRQVRQFQDQTFAPRQDSGARGNGNGKRAKLERLAPVEIFAVGQAQRPEAAGRQRWKNERHTERASRAGFEARPEPRVREVVPYALGQRSERGFRSDRKFEMQVAKQQRAAYRAEARQERQGAKLQRQSLKQTARFAPFVAYERSFADYPRMARYADATVYRVPEVREFRSYPAYTTGYDYAPYYRSYDADGYAGWAHPQSYTGYSPYSTYSPHSPYDVGYSNAGLGGLLGGSSGGLGDILVTLLPLILGDSLGLDGLNGSLGTGLLDNAVPGLASGYLTDHPDVGYADPVYSFQDPSISNGLLGAGQNLSGGDDLMSLVELALGSRLLGGEAGGLGGLGGLLGLGGGLGLGDGLSAPDPIYAYNDPYASNTGLLSVFGF